MNISGLGKDYETIINDIKSKYETQDKEILRYFVDNKDKLTGFSWIRNN